MAIIELTDFQKEMLKSAQFNPIEIRRYKLVEPLHKLGLIRRSWYRTSISEYAITPAGLAYLYQDEPMVDQPQPPSEIEPQSFKVGDLVYYVNAHNHTCTATVMNVTSDVVTILTSAGGKLERPASDLQMVTGSYNDDLPFTVIGNDPDDTQELPTVKVEAEMSLSQLVDAALNEGGTNFQAFKAYDFSTVPLWIFEIELTDMNALKWELWHEAKNLSRGSFEQQCKMEVTERAFEIAAILYRNAHIYWAGELS